jgi:leucyl aminopeptidase (aminopeptidase T)
LVRKKVVEYAYNALIEVMGANQGEKIVIVCDDSKERIGEVFTKASLKASLYTRMELLETDPDRYREEPSQAIRHVFSVKRPDLAINLLRGIAEETPFRIQLINLETRNKEIRLGHGPGITWDMLTDGALALSIEEYEKMNSQADRIISATWGAQRIEVTTPRGTNVELSIQNRGFFKDTTITGEKWGNLPTGEVTVGPIETSLKGVIVCDLAIGGVGLIEKNLKIISEEGKVKRVMGEGLPKAVLGKVKQALSMDMMASVIGEMGIGLNPKARIMTEFLESEKVYGTVHFAFGRNIDYPTGGENNSANHMDFLMSEPSVVAYFSDGREVEIIRDGKIRV